MSRLRKNILPLYLIAALIAFGHAARDFYREARLDGRAAEDAVLISGLMGAVAAAGWPLYAASKAWGMR